MGGNQSLINLRRPPLKISLEKEQAHAATMRSVDRFIRVQLFDGLH
jgi:hypothetical protein